MANLKIKVRLLGFVLSSSLFGVSPLFRFKSHWDVLPTK